MGRQRNVFHVYAHDHVSPAEIIRRMLRHVDGEEMITLACVSLDPYTAELTYSCAGHPPPLLVDRRSGVVRRLADASAPPIGVAEPAEIVEARVKLSADAVLAMYTDGLIERRGQSIDAGIDVLGRMIVTAESIDPDRIVRNVNAEIGVPDDDVALLLIATDGSRVPFEVDLPAEPSSLPPLRRRLRAWLAGRGCDTETAADLLLAVGEACNNAIEHAYAVAGGTIRVAIDEHAGTITAVIEDQGTWRETTPSDERGRGVTLMRHLTHDAKIETEPGGGTRVTLVRRRRADGHQAARPVPAEPMSEVDRTW
jgi:anti-sigma regulatory factor (Ser/Thr protein kinase)